MRILIVEDEKILAGQLAEQLRLSGFVTDLCHDGNEAGFLGETEPYDAIILDLGLPGRDGLSVLKEWRSKGMDTPVLVLTARGQLHEKIEGLNAGADDYLTKPFQVAELVARVQALVRRAAGNASSILEIGGVRLDMAASQVWYEGTPIKLTAHEFRVLGYLMQHRGKVVSRSELIDHIYAQDFDRDSNTVEVFIGRIRKKTQADLIETVQWQGRTLTLRPVRPEDEAQHRAFLESLDPGDIRLRLFYTRRYMERSELARLVQIDYTREMAFIATAPDENGREQTLGVARASADPDNQGAEFGIILRHGLKGAGLGRRLMDKLIGHFRAAGTREMTAVVLKENRAMRELGHALGFSDQPSPDDPDIRLLTLALQARTP